MHYSMYNNHTRNVILGKVVVGEESGEASKEGGWGVITEWIEVILFLYILTRLV